MIIQIPYRPSPGGMASAGYALVQRDDFSWVGLGGEKWGRPLEDDLTRALKALNKNSRKEHQIQIWIDSDMVANPDWLSEYKNVSVHQSTAHSNMGVESYDRTFNRYSKTVRESILSLPDNEYAVYAYIADLICCRDWDHYLEEAHKRYGDDYVYSPVWVEPRTPIKHPDYFINGLNIWDLQHGWRQDVCHALIFPIYPSKAARPAGSSIPTYEDDALLESDLEQYYTIARNTCPYGTIFLEAGGQRQLGYFTAQYGKTNLLKQKIQSIVPQSGWDLEYESSFEKKVVVTGCFIFHSHLKVKLDLP